MSGTLTVSINNSTDDIVRITDGFPVILWDFDGTEIAVPDSSGGLSQTTYVQQEDIDLRVSTSSDNLGLNSFSGNLISTGRLTTSGTQYTYYGAPLRRGQTYYGQIRIGDSQGDVTDWVTFQFKFNNIPIVTNVSILPSNPSISDDLVLSYVYYDADEDLESGTLIRWFKNGVHERQFDNSLRIDSRYLSYNDSWMIDILPSDGYELGERVASEAVNVLTTSPVAANVRILPQVPNENDILKADYDFTSDVIIDQSNFYWYVNEVLQSDFNNQQFVRLTVSPGDDVRFEMTPYNGVSYGTTVSSTAVEIQSADFVVTNIRVDGQLSPLNILTTRPVITWDVTKPGGRQNTYISLRIGKVPGFNDIYSVVLNSRLEYFNVPVNLLHRGTDYYVSIAVSDSNSFSKYVVSHFRVTGSRWSEEVSNSTGWTIESSFIVNTGTSSSFDYQVVRFEDGTRFGELRIYADKLELFSNETSTSNAFDLSNAQSVTIVGKGDDVKIYLDKVLVIDGTGKFLQSSTSKRLEVGTIYDNSIEVYYRSFFYTVLGAFYPDSSSEYNEIVFYTYVDFIFNEIVAVNGIMSDFQDYKVLAVNPYDEEEGGSVYKVTKDVPKRYPTVNRTFSPINRVTLSQDQTYTAFSHARGLTIFNNYWISTYDYSLDFTTGGTANLPNNNLWDLVQNIGKDVVSIDGSGITIDTSFNNIGTVNTELPVSIR